MENKTFLSSQKFPLYFSQLFFFIFISRCNGGGFFKILILQKNWGAGYGIYEVNDGLWL